MLQVVEGSAIGNRSHQRSQLQGGHRNTLAEGTHATDSAFAFGQYLLGINAKLLAGYVPACQLAQAKGIGVVAHPLEAQTAAESLKIKVVRLGQSLGHVHVIVTTQIDRGILGDDALLQGGQRDRNLDRRTRLSATREGQLLVDHGQNAAIARVNRYSCAVHIAQGVDRGLAHHWIFSGSHISLSDV